MSASASSAPRADTGQDIFDLLVDEWPAGQDSPVTVDVVIVGAIGGPPPEDWALCSEHWRKTLVYRGTRVRVLAYKHSLSVNEVDRLCEAGLALAAGLMALSESASDRDRQGHALLLAGHSLGCFIIQQVLPSILSPSLAMSKFMLTAPMAMCTAHSQGHSHPQMSIALRSVIGLLLLGIPNLASLDGKQAANKIINVLKCSRFAAQRKTITAVADWVSDLVGVSRFFLQLRFDIPILSFYENSRTRTTSTRLPSKIQVIDRDSALSMSSSDHAVQLEGDHFDLCRLEQAPGRPSAHVQSWLQGLLHPPSIDKLLKQIHSPEEPDPAAATTFLQPGPLKPRRQASDEAGAGVTTSSTPYGQLAEAGSSTHQDWDIIAPMEALKLPRKQVKLPCYMIDTPVRNKDFSGREAIMSGLKEALLPSPTSSNNITPKTSHRKHVVLCGMGGLGKTSIAIEFVFAHQGDFDAVFWVRAEDKDKLALDFGRIASRLELQDPDEKTDPLISRELVMGWLANPRRVLDDQFDLVGQEEIRWLLIFDNADTPESLQDYWPVSESGSVLVTSRSPLSKMTPSKATTFVEVPLLADADATSLLCQLSGREPSEQGCLDVVKCLSGLPLAIAQIAATIKRLVLSFSDFLGMYKNMSTTAKLYRRQYDGGLGPEARGNLATIWAIDQLSAGAKALLKIFAMLDPDSISEAVLRRAFDGSGSLVEATSERPRDSLPVYTPLLDGYPTDALQYFEARSELLLASIVTTHNEDRNELTIHRLVQDSIKVAMDSDEIVKAYGMSVSLVKGIWCDTPLVKRHDWKLSLLRAPLFPHASCLKDFFERQHPGISPDSKVELGTLMNEAAWWQHERGGSAEAKSYWQMALDLSKEGRYDSLARQSLESDAHYGLNAAAQETNDFGLTLEHTRLLRDQRLKYYSQTKTADLRLAIAHNEYGAACALNGMFDEAMREYERSIEMYRALPDYALAMDTNPRMNLGFLCWMMGDLDRATNTFENIIRDREARWGPNDRESYRSGRVRHGLGNVLYSQGRYPEGKRWHQQAFDLYQEMLGDGAPKTANLAHRMAMYHLLEGDFDACQKLVDQASAVFNRRKEVLRPELARTTFLKYRLLCRKDETVAAEATLEEARQLRNGIPGVQPKDGASLSEADFDSLVGFFSR